MPDAKMVIFVELLFPELRKIINLLPCVEAYLYFQGEPGPKPEFTDTGMNGLSQIIYLNIYESQKLISYHVWWRKIFNDEWKLLF